MMTSVHIGAATLDVVQGDITMQAVDAIVNAANDHLWMGGGVAGAIKRRGGVAIEKEAMAQAPIPIGTCVLTSAGELPATRVIHAAVMGQDLHTNADSIARATAEVLRMADYEEMRSVALPAFGTGVGGFPMAACAAIMLDAAIAALQHVKHLTLVRFVLFDSDSLAVFSHALAQRFSAHLS